MQHILPRLYCRNSIAKSDFVDVGHHEVDYHIDHHDIDHHVDLVEVLGHVDHHEVVYSALTVRLPSGRKS